MAGLSFFNKQFLGLEARDTVRLQGSGLQKLGLIYSAGRKQICSEIVRRNIYTRNSWKSCWFKKNLLLWESD